MSSLTMDASQEVSTEQSSATTSAVSYVAPMSFSQERLFFLDRLSTEKALYAILYRLEFAGPVDAHALDWALHHVIERHEVLRSVFLEHDGLFVQRVLLDAGFRLERGDLSERADVDQAVSAAAREFGGAPYDLGNGPLIRALLLRLAPTRHILLLGMHHIVFDGPSGAIMAHELDEFYRAELEQREPRLVDLPIQYADFAQWQRQRQLDGEFDSDVAYWKAALAEVPTVLALPVDRPRPAVRTNAGSTVEVDLHGAVSDALTTLSHSCGVTPFVAFSALLNVLLSIHSEQSDWCLGFPVAGRDHPDLEGLIGFFSNTLVLRPQISLKKRVTKAIEQTRDCLLDALSHAQLPFDQLVEALTPERSLGWHPLFQVCAVYQSEEDLWALGPAHAAFTPTDVGISKFDLTFYYEERPAGATLRIEYSTELFDPATIDRLQRGFQQLCLSASACPQACWDQLDFLSQSERSSVLAISRGERPSLPTDSLATRFEAQVRRTPSHIAVEGAGAGLTYAELDRRANRLARRLRAAGTAAEDRIAIVSSRGFARLIGVLAILKADAAYVPLDPGYPARRLQFMVEDCKARLVIGDRDSLALLADWGRPAIDIDAVMEEVGADLLPLPRRLEHPEQLAYVMYTSGSTGLPKGVAITHRAVVRLVTGTTFLPFAEGLRFAQISNFSFDASTLEFWGALLHGGTLVLFEDVVQLQPDRFRDFLSRHRISSLFVTVALLTRLVEVRPEAFHGVRHVMYGGDRADAATLKRMRAHGFTGELINGYGPTETTTFACTHPTDDIDIGSGDIPIGTPIASTDAYVLSPSMQLLPVGVPGELYVGGAGLARGYLGRPALTAERFVPNPFVDDPGARLYRTGDRCRWNADGTLRYIARIDDQAKIDGFRIEPEEVRLTVLQCPGVRQAAVQVQQFEGGPKHLMAWVTGTCTSDEVKGFLRSALPRHMVPAQVHAVSELLLTANGKVDFAALGRTTGDARAASAAARAPSSLAAAFFAIVADQLGLATVGEDDRYFDIGGTSLGAMRLAARTEAELGRHLSLGTIFQARRLGDISVIVESLPRRANTRPRRRAENNGLAPMSFSQERLFFLDRLQPGSAVYAVPYRLELNGEIDESALERALHGLVERHEVLRTCFAERDGHFYQQVMPQADFRLPVQDLFRDPEATLRVEAIAGEFARSPYDLSRGPLIRARLLRLGARRHVLLLGLHHIVFDGPSAVVMARDLDELYTAAVQGRPARLAELPLQYADFAEWQRKRFADGELDQDLAYWKQTLSGAPTLLQLPLDRPRKSVRRYSGRALYRELDGEQRTGLLSVAQQLGVTPFVVFSAVLNLLLARYSGQDDICVGFPVGGRGDPDLEGLVGFFSNTVVLRCRVPAQTSFRRLIEDTHATVLGALEHAELPFDKIVEAIDPVRSPAWNPLFQVCAVSQATEDHWCLAGVRALPAATDVEISKFDLTFTLEQGPGTLRVMSEYSDELFSEHTASAMLQALIGGLAQCVADVDGEARIALHEAVVASPAQSLRRRR